MEMKPNLSGEEDATDPSLASCPMFRSTGPRQLNGTASKASPCPVVEPNGMVNSEWTHFFPDVYSTDDSLLLLNDPLLYSTSSYASSGPDDEDDSNDSVIGSKEQNGNHVLEKAEELKRGVDSAETHSSEENGFGSDDSSSSDDEKEGDERKLTLNDLDDSDDEEDEEYLVGNGEENDEDEEGEDDDEEPGWDENVSSGDERPDRLLRRPEVSFSDINQFLYWYFDRHEYVPPKIGDDHQAVIDPLLYFGDEAEASRLQGSDAAWGGTLCWDSTALSEGEVDGYINRLQQTYGTRRVNLEKALQLLHEHNYSVTAAERIIAISGAQVVTKEEFSKEDRELLVMGWQRYGRDRFSRVQAEYLPGKSLNELTNYFDSHRKSLFLLADERSKQDHQELQLQESFKKAAFYAPWHDHHDVYVSAGIDENLVLRHDTKVKHLLRRTNQLPPPRVYPHSNNSLESDEEADDEEDMQRWPFQINNGEREDSEREGELQPHRKRRRLHRLESPSSSSSSSSPLSFSSSSPSSPSSSPSEPSSPIQEGPSSFEQPAFSNSFQGNGAHGISKGPPITCNGYSTTATPFTPLPALPFPIVMDDFTHPTSTSSSTPTTPSSRWKWFLDTGQTSPSPSPSPSPSMLPFSLPSLRPSSSPSPTLSFSPSQPSSAASSSPSFRPSSSSTAASLSLSSPPLSSPSPSSCSSSSFNPSVTTHQGYYNPTEATTSTFSSQSSQTAPTTSPLPPALPTSNFPLTLSPLAASSPSAPSSLPMTGVLRAKRPRRRTLQFIQSALSPPFTVYSPSSSSSASASSSSSSSSSSVSSNGKKTE
ncbi:Metastasis-associated protein mta3 [Balamuthia mandrillaris]